MQGTAAPGRGWPGTESTETLPHGGLIMLSREGTRTCPQHLQLRTIRMLSSMERGQALNPIPPEYHDGDYMFQWLKAYMRVLSDSLGLGISKY